MSLANPERLNYNTNKIPVLARQYYNATHRGSTLLEPDAASRWTLLDLAGSSGLGASQAAPGNSSILVVLGRVTPWEKSEKRPA